MNVFTIEVAWGERLNVEISRWETRTGLKRSYLFSEVGAAMDVSRNTIAKLTRSDSVPEKNWDIQRAYLLLMWIGCNPIDFGIDADELPPRLLREVTALVKRGEPWTFGSPAQPPLFDLDLVAEAAAEAAGQLVAAA